MTDSDYNVKNTITALSEPYSILFDNLKPVTYKYNNGTSDRLHVGFIAQDVASALNSAGLTTQEFAGYASYKNKDGNDTLALRYEEFIALCVNEIQRLKKRITELESSLNI
jgi:hypothetical protein